MCIRDRIGLTKDTSLASSITVVELFTTAQQIAARTYEPFALYCEADVYKRQQKFSS